MEYYTLITKRDCPLCQDALKLLEEKGEQFIYTDMQSCPPALEVIKLQARHSTVPMIWKISFGALLTETSAPLSNEFIGGYDDLVLFLKED